MHTLGLVRETIKHTVQVFLFWYFVSDVSLVTVLNEQ